MEGLSVHWERAVFSSTPVMRADIFRPMRRAVTDLSIITKRREKLRQVTRHAGNCHPCSTWNKNQSQVVPVASVQYDVPKNASVCSCPTQVNWKYKRSPTIQKLLGNKLRNEDKNQVTSVDSHKIKGLGVGKCYGGYQTLTSAPGLDDPGLAPLSLGPVSHTQLSLAQYPATVPGNLRRDIGQMPASLSQTPGHCATSIHNHTALGCGPQMGAGHLLTPSQVTCTLDTGDGATGCNKFYRLRRGATFNCGDTVQSVTDRYLDLYLGLGSSSTPTVPYSTADILYGSEVNARSQLDEVRQNSYGEIERGRDLGTPARQRSKELELHANNRRPSSKSGSRKSLSIEAVTIDREKDEPLKSHSATLPPTKATNHFRPNGIRNNILKGEQLLTGSSSRPNGTLPSAEFKGRDPDDLVAMGTLWSPNQPGSQSQQQQMLQSRNSIPNNSINNNSYAAKGNVNASSSGSTTMTPQRKTYTSNNVRPIVVNNVSGIRNSLRERDKKVEEEPKYTDPLLGAPASFQQRLIELGALEGDTVRWERTKKLKKKKQDRDS